MLIGCMGLWALRGRRAKILWDSPLGLGSASGARGLVAPRRGGMVRLWVWDLRPGVRPLGGVAYRYRLRRRTLIIVRDADGCGRNACEVRPYEQCVRG